MPFDKEMIGQAQGHEPAAGLRELDGPLECCGGPGRVQQVALDVHRRRGPYEDLLDGRSVDHDACAQIRRHRPARVGADQHKALAGAQFDGATAQDAPNTDPGEVALVLLTENVMADGPHERRVRAQGGETDCSVGGRSPGHKDPAVHELGDPRDLVAADEGHGARLDSGHLDRPCIHSGDAVDDRVPDAHNIGLATGEVPGPGAGAGARQSKLRHES